MIAVPGCPQSVINCYSTCHHQRQKDDGCVKDRYCKYDSMRQIVSTTISILVCSMRKVSLTLKQTPSWLCVAEKVCVGVGISAAKPRW